MTSPTAPALLQPSLMTRLLTVLHDRRRGDGRDAVTAHWANGIPDARDWSVGALLTPSRPASR